MRKQIISMFLAVVMVVGMLPNVCVNASVSDSSEKTANQAVQEMTWGVNLADLYIAEPAEDLRKSESSIGYDDYTPKEVYDLCIAAWFWDNSFQWICTYPTEKQDAIQISIPIPDYDAAVAVANEGWAFLTIRCGDKTGGNNYKITLSDCKITGADGTILKNTNDFGSNWDGVLTAEGTTSSDPDTNGWYWGYGSQENNWTAEIAYFAGEWDESAWKMGTGADPKYNGATFTATLTIDTAAMQPTESKVEYYYCLNRTESDYKALIDTYMEQGVNVFRLPVTWTWFTQNDGEFTIDEAWLEAIKGTVDYILSKGAYCILNSHDDYLQYSYVAESDGNGGYTNFHWEDQWMEDQYKEYVDARFTAIWTQIADYFKDCSDHLIFESMNEPSMNWYYGVDYENWRVRQSNRVNEMNALFVETVRAVGGNNATRILCLPTNYYCSHQWLDELTIPEDSDYIMAQIHSYADVEDNEWNNTATMDTLFSNVAAFQSDHPKVPLIVGEAGISHSLANRADPDGTATVTEAFVKRAAENGMPCLWWEDFFAVYDGIEADKIYWVYDKANDTWRETVLSAIQQALDIGNSDDSGDSGDSGGSDASDPSEQPDLGEPEATGYYHTHGQSIIDPEGNVCILKGISFGNKNYSNPSNVEDTDVRNDHDADSYKELAAMGLDHVRFEFNYGLFEDDDNVGVYKQAGFDWIDENIAAAKEAGIKLILQMKSPQGGYQNSTATMYGPDSGGKALWIDLDENGNVLSTENYKGNQTRLVNLWKAIAEYYKDEPTIIGYGLLNEPAVPQKDTAKETVGQWKNLAQRIADAIRTVDSNHILFVENLCSYFLPGNYNETDWEQVSLADSQFTINDTNTVYEFHFYEPLKYTHQGADWLMTTYGDCYYDGTSLAELEINDWNSKGTASASAVAADGEWTYFESSNFAISDTYNVAQPQINMDYMPAGSSIWVDDLMITRTSITDGTTTTLLSYDFTDSVDGFFKVWNQYNDYNAIALDSSVGHNAPGAMKLTNNLSTAASQWASAQSWDNVVLEEGYTYKISGYIKGGTSYNPLVSFLKADNAWLMNKAYLNHLLDKYCAFGSANNVPLHVGEWGFHYNCYDKGIQDYVKDLTALFEEKGLSSNYHSYHDSTFGLYLSEEYEERPDRNNTLLKLLTTYYCTPTVTLLTGIEITSMPTKTEYTAGEPFDSTGMVVTVTYLDNSTDTVSGYTYAPNGELTVDDTVITVFYTENGYTARATFDISVIQGACDHIDEDRDHVCDRECGEENMGNHEDSTEDKDHLCDYGCGERLEDCSDKENDGDHSCDICGDGDITGHNYGDATCETPSTCPECSWFIGEALGHIDEDTDHKCDRNCGEENMGNHEDSTEDKDHLCDYGCGERLEDCSDKENDGDHSCDICGEGDVSGHNYGDATCETPSTCPECSWFIGQALGHIDEDTDHKCDRNCGEENMGNHEDSTEDKDHLCDYGCKVRLEDCSDANGDGDHSCDVCGEGNITEHNYGDATCETPSACSECGDTTGEALGHNEVVDEAVAATCTRTGLAAGTHCSVCGKVLITQAEVPATGHSFTAYTDDEAVCDNEGCEETVRRMTEANWTLTDTVIYGREYGTGIMAIALYNQHGRMLAIKFCPATAWMTVGEDVFWRYDVPEFDADLLAQATVVLRFNFDQDYVPVQTIKPIAGVDAIDDPVTYSPHRSAKLRG